MEGELVRFRVAELGFPEGATTSEIFGARDARDPTKVTIVILSLEDLGFPDGALTREIIGAEQDTDQHGNPAPFTSGRGRQLGLELCSPEVGPYYRLEYRDQPLGERLYIAMKPMATSDDEPRIFALAHDAEGLSLDAARARPDDNWHPEDKFVFCTQP